MFRRQAYFTKGWTKPVESEMPAYAIKSPGIGINFRTPIYYETRKGRNETYSLEKAITNPGLPSYTVSSTPSLDPPDVIERDQMTKSQRDKLLPEPTVTAKEIVQSGSGYMGETPPANLIVKAARVASFLDKSEEKQPLKVDSKKEEKMPSKRATKEEGQISKKKTKMTFNNFKIE